jgi:hypothetical protein
MWQASSSASDLLFLWRSLRRARRAVRSASGSPDRRSCTCAGTNSACSGTAPVCGGCWPASFRGTRAAEASADARGLASRAPSADDASILETPGLGRSEWRRSSRTPGPLRCPGSRSHSPRQRLRRPAIPRAALRHGRLDRGARARSSSARRASSRGCPPADGLRP